MKRLNKQELLAEAEAESRALGTIRKWLAGAIGISTISVAIIIFGFAGEEVKLLPAVFGSVLLALSLICAFLINLGLKRGARNVEIILSEAEKM